MRACARAGVHVLDSRGQITYREVHAAPKTAIPASFADFGPRAELHRHIQQRRTDLKGRIDLVFAEEMRNLLGVHLNVAVEK